MFTLKLLRHISIVLSTTRAYHNCTVSDTPQFRGGNPYFFSENLYRCRDKFIPAVKFFPPPVTLPSVLSAVCIAQN